MAQSPPGRTQEHLPQQWAARGPCPQKPEPRAWGALSPAPCRRWGSSLTPVSGTAAQVQARGGPDIDSALGLACPAPTPTKSCPPGLC